MTVRVLCDAIHADLWESIRILVEDRWGWELYAPHGMEWYEAGIFNFERARLGDAVARQFLEPWHVDAQVRDTELVETGPLRTLSYSLRPGTTHPSPQKRVTLEQARDLKPDVIISTLVENDLGWYGFAQEVGATFGIQVGNQGAAAAWSVAEFAMLSVTTPDLKPWRPHVYYHQEFSLADFYPDGGLGGLQSKEVATCVQCYAGGPDYGLFLQLAARTEPEATWRHYGHCGVEDEHFGGNSPTTKGVAERMHKARVAWHWKRWSDGYGHVIHNWAAIGRPMLVTSTYYQDKLAAPLFVEGRTSFNLEDKTVDELEAIVRRLLQDDDLYTRMSHDAAARFAEVVDFAAEADQLRAMIEGAMK